MEIKLPESSKIDPFHKVEGSMKDAKALFYELAKNKIKYPNREEIIQWGRNHLGTRWQNFEATASFVLCCDEKKSPEGVILEKWVENLEIVINKDILHRNKKDYSDLVPFFVEHEIYETWLFAKKGAASELDPRKQHLLARRREFLLAEMQGLGDKLLEFHMSVNPKIKEEYEYALESARKKLKFKKIIRLSARRN